MSLFGPSKKELARMILLLETDLRAERAARTAVRSDLLNANRQVRELTAQLAEANRRVVVTQPLAVVQPVRGGLAEVGKQPPLDAAVAEAVAAPWPSPPRKVSVVHDAPRLVTHEAAATQVLPIINNPAPAQCPPSHVSASHSVCAGSNNSSCSSGSSCGGGGGD